MVCEVRSRSGVQHVVHDLQQQHTEDAQVWQIGLQHQVSLNFSSMKVTFSPNYRCPLPVLFLFLSLRNQNVIMFTKLRKTTYDFILGFHPNCFIKSVYFWQKSTQRHDTYRDTLKYSRAKSTFSHTGRAFTHNAFQLLWFNVRRCTWDKAEEPEQPFVVGEIKTDWWFLLGGHQHFVYRLTCRVQVCCCRVYSLNRRRGASRGRISWLSLLPFRPVIPTPHSPSVHRRGPAERPPGGFLTGNAVDFSVCGQRCTLWFVYDENLFKGEFLLT